MSASASSEVREAFMVRPYSRRHQLRAMVGPGGNALLPIVVASIAVLGVAAVLLQPTKLDATAKLLACLMFVAIPAILVERLGSDRIRWTGHAAMIGTASKGGRVFAREGAGFVVRATVTDGTAAGGTYLWFGNDGWPYLSTPLTRWDASDLDQIVAAARLAVVEAGEVTMGELHQRYPLLRGQGHVASQRALTR